MVDEKMTCALNNYCAVFASFCVSKNIKQTWEDLSFYFQYHTVRIFTGISILASFYMVLSLGN